MAMASGADPLQTLQAALTARANSKEQADLLATLRESLERNPAPIPILVNTLLSVVVGAAGDSLLKRWVIDLFHFALSRSTLSLDHRTHMASQALDTVAHLIDDSNPSIVKLAIQCFTAIYPLLFRHLCTNRTNHAAWTTITTAKARIIDLLWSQTASPLSLGVKLCAMKFVHRVILVQMRGISDPRLQNKNDPNLSFCPADHPFIAVVKLENEGRELLERIMNTLYSSQNPDLLCAMLNSWSGLVKLRPAMVPFVIGTLKTWTPTALVNLPASGIKSVEKTIRILLMHISRIPSYSQYVPQITEILSQQGVRMDKATAEEKKRKAAATAAAAAVAAASYTTDTRKRAPSTPAESADAKRPKLDSIEPSSASATFLASFDFTSLPATLITELIVSNLDVFTAPTLEGLIQTYRESHGLGISPPAAEPSAKVKDEPVDPLQMDIDQDDLEYEPDRLNEELSGDIPAETSKMDMDQEPVWDVDIANFKVPPPRPLSEEERMRSVDALVKRIWDDAEEFKATGDVGSGQTSQRAIDIWMLLLIRMITRVVYPEEDVTMEDSEPHVQEFYTRQDRKRQTLCDYIMVDFPGRLSLATLWMNEEWYNDQVRLSKDRIWRPNYEIWLSQIVSSYQTLLDGKDRTFARFLLDLPHVPADVLDLLRDLCLDTNSPDRMQVGYTTLRGLVIQRPSMRAEALTVLLELTTHAEKKTRAAAINSVKMWVPNIQPMDGMVREFALQMLRKLQSQPVVRSNVDNDVTMNGDSHKNGYHSEAIHPLEGQDENMEDGQIAPEPLIHTPYLPDRIALPAEKSQVLQHVELLFALSVKVPEFLDEIFVAYCQMDLSVQEAIQDLITALVRSLGPAHGKLLTLMRTCPVGAESLALRVLTIFTENGRPSPQLVGLIKGLINERNLDARFLIPIIAEMDKSDIVRHLPRIVSVLNGQQEQKNLVRSVFGSIVTTPPQTFGSVTSNLPRVRQSELLTPAELMVLLHDSEKEIGLKSAIEAIGICFSMTDVFRSEILAVVMQQIMDEPVLPVLFLRTVIQAVTTYKTLVGFVSTTLLSRLITKKIWTNPPLWEGFIRCAKVIAPASFGALLQLPKDQLRELVDKQPSLKAGLREYVTKKATNKARVAGFLDIFSEQEENAVAPPPSDESNVTPSAESASLS